MENISIVNPRTTVEIYLPDGRALEGPRNTPVGEFLKKLPEWDNPPIVASVVNGLLRELTYLIQIDSVVEVVTVSDSDGARIYRRSLTFLLEASFQALYPNATLTIDHAVESGGFYCQIAGLDSFSEKDLNPIRKLYEQFS